VIADKRSFRQVGPGRYREAPGLQYEEVEVGIVIEHRPGRTLTEADAVLQTQLHLNPSPLHLDAAYASTTRWGRPLVSSLVTFSIVNAMTVASLSMRAIANLGWDQVRFGHPCFAGDTLYAESELLDKRLSKQAPDQGIVRFRTVARTDAGNVVMSCERAVLLPTQAHAMSRGDYF
jgi:itaconyl-CoA hydratase